MYFNTLILLFIAQTASKKLDVQQPLLTVQPQSCVALNKGRACYTQLTFSWKASKNANYCLKDLDSRDFIYCWDNANSGNIKYEFENQQSREFQLINSDTGALLGQTQVKVQWVYKNRQKKRRWRVF